jgi:translation initiation factor 1 (eIF-1/SUI1)
MIISQRTRITPNRLTAGVLALSIGLLPLGVAYAQDFEAVDNRLRQAVTEGELSDEQASIMIQTLRRTAMNEDTGQRGKGYDLEEHKTGIEQRLHRLGENLRSQFAAGVITKEEMETKYQAAEKEMWERYREVEMQNNRSVPGKDHDLVELKTNIEQRLHSLSKNLRSQFAAGVITKEEMETKYQAAEKEMWERYREAEMQNNRGVPGKDHDLVELMSKAVAGEISEEEALRRIVEMQIANIKAHIKNSVNDGEMTRSQADALFKRLGY